MNKIKEKPMSGNAPMYIYATEMVGDYYRKLHMKGKKVLTICGSGDQVLNAYYLGAKEVVGFDLNKNSKFILNLKIAVIKNLEYSQFLDFFGKKSFEGSFDYKTYQKIEKSLDKETKRFFEILYKKYNYIGKKFKQSNHFRQRFHLGNRLCSDINIYLNNKKNYNKLKKLLPKTNFLFVRSDVTEIWKNKKLINKKFDIINLSNVLNYLTRESKAGRDPIKYVIDNVLVKLSKMTSKKGSILFISYSEKNYPNLISHVIPSISTKEGMKKIRQKFKVTRKSYEGVVMGTKDKITIIKKSNKLHRIY